MKKLTRQTNLEKFFAEQPTEPFVLSKGLELSVVREAARAAGYSVIANGFDMDGESFLATKLPAESVLPEPEAPAFQSLQGDQIARLFPGLPEEQIAARSWAVFTDGSMAKGHRQALPCYVFARTAGESARANYQAARAYAESLLES